MGTSISSEENTLKEMDTSNVTCILAGTEIGRCRCAGTDTSTGTVASEDAGSRRGLVTAYCSCLQWRSLSLIIGSLASFARPVFFILPLAIGTQGSRDVSD